MRHPKGTAKSIISRVFIVVVWASGTLPVSLAIAEEEGQRAPAIFANDAQGMRVGVAKSRLCNFELDLLAQFGVSQAPDEVFVLAADRPGKILLPEYGFPVARTVILIRGKTGELRKYDGDDEVRYFRRTVSEKEIEAIRKFISENGIDDLPELGATRRGTNGEETTTIGGGEYLYLHLTRSDGRRVLMNNPPTEDTDAPAEDIAWRYSKLVAFLSEVAEVQGMEMCYAFRRPIEGLEVLYARPDMEVLDVWMDGDDVCVTVKKKWPYEAPREHRVLRDNVLGKSAANPNRDVEFIVEAGGTKLVLARSSTDGRWVVGNRREDGELVCYDRQLMRFVAIADAEARTSRHALYFLEVHNVFLLSPADKTSTARAMRGRLTWDWRGFRILDPRTGEVHGIDALSAVDTSAVSKMAFWLQELPRELQPSEHKDKIWAAQPLDNATEVLEFDMRELRPSAGYVIPNLRFETKQMWVDDVGQKVYVVYKGHLLSVPLQFPDVPPP
jgi:hypothetical protein